MNSAIVLFNNALSPVGVLRAQASNFIHPQTDFQTDLPMRNLAVHDMAARLGDLKPLDMTKGGMGSLNGTFDCVVRRLSGRTYQFNLFVDVIRHRVAPLDDYGNSRIHQEFASRVPWRHLARISLTGDAYRSNRGI